MTTHDSAADSLTDDQIRLMFVSVINEYPDELDIAFARGLIAADHALRATQPPAPAVPTPTNAADSLTDEQITAIFRKSFNLIDSRPVGAQLGFVRAIIAADRKARSAHASASLTAYMAADRALRASPAPVMTGPSDAPMRANLLMRYVDAYAADYAKDGKLGRSRIECERAITSMLATQPSAPAVPTPDRKALAGEEDAAEAELNCAEEWLDHYAAKLDLKQTAFDCIGDYIVAVVDAAIASLPAPTQAAPVAVNSLLEWACYRWRMEVADRPLVNVHRRTLDDTWRQVIRFAGGDPVSLVGPAHDDLLIAAHQEGKT